MQAARDLVGILVELTAGMELGHDDLGRRDAFILVDVDGNTAAIVAHGDRAVGVQRHVDAVAEAGERFVDGVVDHLVDHVMQAGAVIGVADIHARALAHGVQAFSTRIDSAPYSMGAWQARCRQETYLRRVRHERPSKSLQISYSDNRG